MYKSILLAIHAVNWDGSCQILEKKSKVVSLPNRESVLESESDYDFLVNTILLCFIQTWNSWMLFKLPCEFQGTHFSLIIAKLDPFRWNIRFVNMMIHSKVNLIFFSLISLWFWVASYTTKEFMSNFSYIISFMIFWHSKSFFNPSKWSKHNSQ